VLLTLSNRALYLKFDLLYSLSPQCGVKIKEIKLKLGKLDHLRSVEHADHDLRKIYWHGLQQKVRDLKAKHIIE